MQGQDSLLQTHTKSAADCWEEQKALLSPECPEKAGRLLVLFHNGGGGGNIDLSCVSEKLLVESSAHCCLLVKELA